MMLPGNKLLLLRFTAVLATSLVTSALVLGQKNYYVNTNDSQQKGVEGDESRTPKQTPIVWNPSSITLIAAPGQNTTVAVEFTATTEINRMSVTISRPLAGVVRTEPAFFRHVHKGETNRLLVTAALPTSAALGMSMGAIYLEKKDEDDGGTDDDNRKAALRNPLSVTVNVWKPARDPVSGLQFLAPPFSDAVRITSDTSRVGITTIYFQLEHGPQGDFATEFALTIFSNASHLGLNQWFDENVDINGLLSAHKTFKEQPLLDGSIALVSAGPVPGQYLEDGAPVNDAYRISASGDAVISIAQSPVTTLFERGYSQQAIFNLELDVLGTLHFD